MEFQQLMDVVQSFGVWAIFAFLYWEEKKAHAATRQKYYEDLREIAGLRRNIDRVHTYNPDQKQFPPGAGEMVEPAPGGD